MAHSLTTCPTARRAPARVAAAMLVFTIPAAVAGDIVVRNSQTPADNTATRALWLADAGISLAQVQHLVNFESGFTNGQNVSNVPGLFPGGLLIRDSSAANSAIVRSTGFGGSNPVGTLSLAHNELPYLELEFPVPGVDYVALSDIDHTGTRFVVHYEDAGPTTTFNIETTGFSGNSAEFVGIWRNDRSRIVRIQMDASGDGQWGIDDIMYGVVNPACPADFNNDGVANSQDFFDFLAAFFAQTPAADFNNDGVTNSQDFFDYLAAFFAGCP